MAADPRERIAIWPGTLALDLGTRTGWAAWQQGRATSGYQSFAGGRFEGGGMRYLRFGRWLDEMRELVEPDQVVFEEVRGHRGTDAAHVYGGLLAILTSRCEERCVPYVGVPVGSIKRFATGKGNAGKEAMREALVAQKVAPGREELAVLLGGINADADENAIDAWWLLAFTLIQGV